MGSGIRGSGIRVLGIDPGLRHTGWGVVRFEGHHLRWVGDGIISPDPGLADAVRLCHIRDEMAKVLIEYEPAEAFIEEVFMSKNPSSALKLGMARGASMLALAERSISVREISARRVKQNVTGSGRADKVQLSSMVSMLLGVEPLGSDSADALAIAIAATHEHGLLDGGLLDGGLLSRGLKGEVVS